MTDPHAALQPPPNGGQKEQISFAAWLNQQAVYAEHNAHYETDDQHRDELLQDAAIGRELARLMTEAELIAAANMPFDIRGLGLIRSLAAGFPRPIPPEVEDNG